MRMSNLAACSMAACDHLIIDNDAASDTCTERHHDHIVVACSAALPKLSKGSYIGIISRLYSQAGHLRKLFFDRGEAPVQIDRYRYLALIIDRTRYANADTGDFLCIQLLLIDLCLDRRCHIRKDIHTIVFGARLDLPLIQNLTVNSEKSAFYRCSSYVNSKTILLHLYSSFCFPAFFMILFCTRLYSSFAAL